MHRFEGGDSNYGECGWRRGQLLEDSSHVCVLVWSIIVEHIQANQGIRTYSRRIIQYLLRHRERLQSVVQMSGLLQCSRSPVHSISSATEVIEDPREPIRTGLPQMQELPLIHQDHQQAS